MSTQGEIKTTIAQGLLIFNLLKSELLELNPESQVYFAGSMLRFLNTPDRIINDLDVIVVNELGRLDKPIQDYFRNNEKFKVLRLGRVIGSILFNGIQIDITACKELYLESTRLKVTGDSVFNLVLRSYAKLS